MIVKKHVAGSVYPKGSMKGEGMEKAQNCLKGTEKNGVSGAVLKWLAIVTMLIDHFGAAVFIIYTSHVHNPLGGISHADTIYMVMRGIGRTAFPIFCFLLVEGFGHTGHLARYTIRMFVFCLLSEIPFDLAIRGKWMDVESQNVYWTLLLGLLAMTVLERLEKKHQGKPETEREETENGSLKEECVNDRESALWCNPVFYAGARVAVSAFFMGIAWVLRTDYDFKGVALILILYFLRYDRNLQLVTGYLAMLWEAWCFPGFLFMYFYNGKRGRQPKYFFYLFYPCHLILLYLLRIYLKNN